MTTEMSSDGAREFFQRCFRGDVAAAATLLDPGVRYRVPGSHRLAGTFEGPGAVTEHVEALLRETHHTVDVLQWEDWMVGVNYVAGLVHVRLQRAGAVDTLRALFLVGTGPDDRIRTIDVFFSDPGEVDRFFA